MGIKQLAGNKIPDTAASRQHATGHDVDTHKPRTEDIKLLLLLRFVSPFTVPKSTLLLHRQSSSLLRQARDNNSAEQLLAQAKAIRDSIPSSTDTIGTDNDVMVSWSMYKMNLHYRHRIVTIHQAAAALPMITNSRWTLEESPVHGWIHDGVPVDVALNLL
eukprot:scaffold18839_cov61-Cyclotella_meneghiniana.AAC.10